MHHVKPKRIYSADMLEHLREAMNPLKPQLGEQVSVRDVVREGIRRPVSIVYTVHCLIFQELFWHGRAP